MKSYKPSDVIKELRSIDRIIYQTRLKLEESVQNFKNVSGSLSDDELEIYLEEVEKEFHALKGQTWDLKVGINDIMIFIEDTRVEKFGLDPSTIKPFDD
jgi:hypothetical protein